MPSSAHASAGAKIVNSKGDNSNPQGDNDPRGGYKGDKISHMGQAIGATAIKMGNHQHMMESKGGLSGNTGRTK